MTDYIVMGFLMAISFLDTGKYREIPMEGPKTCQEEKDHLLKHNSHIRVICARRVMQPVEMVDE